MLLKVQFEAEAEHIDRYWREYYTDVGMGRKLRRCWNDSENCTDVGMGAKVEAMLE